MYETKRLILEPFEEQDINDARYRSWFNDQEVTKFNSHGLFPLTQKELIDFINSLGSERIVWKIKFKNDVILEWIGNISLQSFNWINRSAEFAIVIGNPGAWGRGYAVEAGLILLNHGFNKMNFNRIWTGTAAENKGMRRVAEKLGMQLEGISRHGMFLEGQYIDVCHYGILCEEFNKNVRY